ncbi:MAG: hypothetical protein EOM68_06580 [Spirochaetia bacterium]|jgi:hypothetical protein|nr:hypothetical protein [Spirochaetia bacterium]
MKKLYICLIALMLLQAVLFAGTFDLGITLGTNAHWGESSYDPSKLTFAWGVTVGISDDWELDLQANSALVPHFFGDTNVAVLLQKSLLGQRSTGTRVAGLGVNTLLGAGLLFSDYFPGNFLLPTHILVSLTPLVVGNPISTKRERAFTLTLAYNFITTQVSVLFDLIKYDFYVVGTYRDYL